MKKTPFQRKFRMSGRKQRQDGSGVGTEFYNADSQGGNPDDDHSVIIMGPDDNVPTTYSHNYRSGHNVPATPVELIAPIDLSKMTLSQKILLAFFLFIGLTKMDMMSKRWVTSHTLISGFLVLMFAIHPYVFLICGGLISVLLFIMNRRDGGDNTLFSQQFLGWLRARTFPERKQILFLMINDIIDTGTVSFVNGDHILCTVACLGTVNGVWVAWSMMTWIFFFWAYSIWIALLGIVVYFTFRFF